MQKMSACEEKVMLVIWQANELLPYKEIKRRVEERFCDAWKAETVCTYIDRLKKKGYIIPIKQGRHIYYAAATKYDDYKKQKLNEFINRLYEGDTSKLIEDLLK